MADAFTVYYFPVRGRGELARTILEYCGIHYENKFPTNWPEEKSKTPFGQLPVLTFKEKGQEIHLAQTMAINRFLGTKYGLFPKDPTQKALAESYMESIMDLYDKLWTVVYRLPEPQKEDAKKDIKDHAIPDFIEKHSKLIAAHGAGCQSYFPDEKICIVDLMLFNMIDDFNNAIPNAFTSQNSKDIWRVREKVGNDPKIKAYVTSTRRHAK